MTPLQHAVMRNHVPTVKMLLERGADIEKKNKEGYSPLALAHRRGEVRGGEGAARRRRPHRHDRRPGSADAADDRGEPGVARRGRHLPARQHAADRSGARAHAEGRQRQRAVEVRRHAADDRGGAQRGADDRPARAVGRQARSQVGARQDGGRHRRAERRGGRGEGAAADRQGDGRGAATNAGHPGMSGVPTYARTPCAWPRWSCSRMRAGECPRR